MEYGPENPLIVLSLGAGVQSSTLALMAAAGEITPMPHCAIFADTGWEPAAVYTWLDWLETQLPFPVYRVEKGNIREEQVTARLRGKKGEDGSRWASLPYFTQNPETQDIGIVRRQCTSEYKIQPIEKKIRDLMGLKPRQRKPKVLTVEQWYGISLNEIQRCKVEFVEPWRRNRYPLVEQRMTRHDCLMWMFRKGYPQPPRSACIGCPFHSDHEWRDMKESHPKEWADAVEFDAKIRRAGGKRGETFLHRSCKPLSEVDLSTPEDKGQGVFSFMDECAGICGV